MTHIYLRENYGQKEIICKGHSGYAMSGADIICSAISILTYSFSRLVIELDEKDKLQINEFEMSDGYMHTLVTDPLNVSGYAFSMLRYGLHSMQESYPENLKIYLEWEDFQKCSVQ